MLASLLEVAASMASNERILSGDGRKLNIVVEGCCHGELPNIYASVVKMEQVFRNFVIFCVYFADFERRCWYQHAASAPPPQRGSCCAFCAKLLPFAGVISIAWGIARRARHGSFCVTLPSRPTREHATIEHKLYQPLEEVLV